MSSVCRVGDVHECDATDTGGSPDVFINGSPAHRFGDGHSHGSIQVGCSPDVMANGLGVARVGDMDSGCPGRDEPSAEASGSPNTMANG